MYDEVYGIRVSYSYLLQSTSTILIDYIELHSVSSVYLSFCNKKKLKDIL